MKKLLYLLLALLLVVLAAAACDSDDPKETENAGNTAEATETAAAPDVAADFVTAHLGTWSSDNGEFMDFSMEDGKPCMTVAPWFSEVVEGGEISSAVKDGDTFVITMPSGSVYRVTPNEDGSLRMSAEGFRETSYFLDPLRQFPSGEDFGEGEKETLLDNLVGGIFLNERTGHSLEFRTDGLFTEVLFDGPDHHLALLRDIEKISLCYYRLLLHVPASQYAGEEDISFCMSVPAGSPVSFFDMAESGYGETGTFRRTDKKVNVATAFIEEHAGTWSSEEGTFIHFEIDEGYPCLSLGVFNSEYFGGGVINSIVLLDEKEQSYRVTMVEDGVYDLQFNDDGTFTCSGTGIEETVFFYNPMFQIPESQTWNEGEQEMLSAVLNGRIFVNWNTYHSLEFLLERETPVVRFDGQIHHEALVTEIRKLGNGAYEFQMHVPASQYNDEEDISAELYFENAQEPDEFYMVSESYDETGIFQLTSDKPNVAAVFVESHLGTWTSNDGFFLDFSSDEGMLSLTIGLWNSGYMEGGPIDYIIQVDAKTRQFLIKLQNGTELNVSLVGDLGMTMWNEDFDPALYCLNPMYQFPDSSYWSDGEQAMLEKILWNHSFYNEQKNSQTIRFENKGGSTAVTFRDSALTFNGTLDSIIRDGNGTYRLLITGSASGSPTKETISLDLFFFPVTVPDSFYLNCEVLDANGTFRQGGQG